MASILIVDDEKNIRKQLFWHLSDEFDVYEASTAKEAKKIINKKQIQIALIDLHMAPNLDSIKSGIEVLTYLNTEIPDAIAIIMTGDQDPQTELEVIDAGAWDIFKKPIELSELSVVLKRALKVQGLVKQNLNLKQAGLQDSDLNIIGACPAIEQVRELIRQVAATDATILIEGESGTGKELIAQAIHSNSSRASRPFIAVNCAALTETLLEDELFGHESGAYTGAKGGRKGKFELADKGTLFLDEIAELTPTAQGKLLRVLQEGTLERLGGERTISVDVRMIAATHQNLREKVKKGEFREDLFYRINVIPIQTPALKDRGNDIELLANHFLTEFRKKSNAGPSSIDTKAMEVLKAYDWPGNVRELRNMIERLVILTKNQIIREQDIPHEFKKGEITNSNSADFEITEDEGYEDLVNSFRKKLIERVLNEEASKSDAAKRLKINRSYLYELIEKLDITLT